MWLSIPGVLLATSGLVLGVWQLFLNRSRWTPYRKFWTRWHHIAGLVAAVFTMTWMFSGLLSMNPFGVFSARGATTMERTQWLPNGVVVDLRGCDVQQALAVIEVLGRMRCSASTKG